MIPDWEKNKVFVSELLKHNFYSEFIEIQEILNNNKIELGIIPMTKDIWARDYMPIQVSENEYVQYRYEPKYLDDYPERRTPPSELEFLKDYNIITSNINLDGGNVVNSKEKVILTNRVFEENPNLSEKEILTELERLFKAEIFFIPAINSDMTGHVDGHLRFINEDTIIVNKIDNEYKYWRDGFEKMIKKSNLNYIEIPWYVDKKDKEHISAIGSYLNYLQLNQIILFPLFGENPNFDQQCINILQTSLPEANIIPININPIGKKGGLMNCITWTRN